MYRSRPLDPELSVKFIQNSLKYGSPEMERIQAMAVDCKINVVLGFSENDHDSLYMSQCVITDEGEIKARRRKIKPTHMERTVFGDSTGDSLNNVVDTSVGRVGALQCWEHINPLLKYHTYHQRELLHVAAWPVTLPHTGGSELWGMTLEESSSFVLHTTTVISEKGLTAMRTGSGSLFNRPGGGASAVYGPDGRHLTKDMSETEEGIIYADLETEKVLEARGQQYVSLADEALLSPLCLLRSVPPFFHSHQTKPPSLLFPIPDSSSIIFDEEEEMFIQDIPWDDGFDVLEDKVELVPSPPNGGGESEQS
ncbi:hypothetical protein KVV02_000565 [Mortierella alpina]|uniref:CN hydrolase domain-containing protein n=1 Tax=Mortierella alpina TaxID=64518 RepID=A0A9P7ZYI9_MORAP|nr:hypothetical protein KVV02_000565 [Mortierella alpina]